MLRATRDQPKSLFRFKYEAITLYGPPFQECSSTKKICNFFAIKCKDCPKPPIIIVWVWASSLSLAATYEMLKLVFFPMVTMLFQFTMYPSNNLSPVLPGFQLLIISDCSGLSFLIRKFPVIALFDSLPRLIAVLHVLHRHKDPRNPPYTLSIF